MAKDSNGEMSFLEHLEELRWHIVRSAAAVIVLAVIAFIFSGFIFDSILLAPKNPEFITNRLLCRLGRYVNTEALCINTNSSFMIQNINMAGQFSADIMVSLIVGVIAAFPYIMWEVWKFIAPALYEKERRHAQGSVWAVSALFLIGAAFGYFVIVPLSVDFLGGYHASKQIVNQIALNSYFSTVAYIPLATGVVFELPLLMIFLTKVGVVNPGFLEKYRRHAYILLLILAAVITPPDVFSQILVVLPLILLFEMSIVMTKRTARKNQQIIEHKKS
ncbi:MAG: twin-arginine translocase subunit TatC [Bacteroidales bacterium]|jgi:sec-independent protein translocase protein TatC|nr:twin-arginine translocase subunit TatC [Bacteroidales bacterium]